MTTRSRRVVTSSTIGWWWRQHDQMKSFERMVRNVATIAREEGWLEGAQWHSFDGTGDSHNDFVRVTAQTVVDGEGGWTHLDNEWA